MISLWEMIKPALSRFVPKHVNDPFGLVGRMLASKNRAALFTLWLTGLAILLSPVDWVLQFFERRCKANKDAQSHGPHIFVCGPARSGTTLVYQVLASALPVTYVRNFTVLFSRSPVLASRLFTRNRRDRRRENYENYYGKTAGIQAPTEANHLWNQWVKADESGFRTRLDSLGADEMARFFKRFSSELGLPTLSKNNNINAFADSIAERLDNAYFICLRRDSRYLVQSLVKARKEINGDIKQSYGVTDTGILSVDTDPISQVMKQVEYLDALAIAQQRKIGEERFWIIDYEAFCLNPMELVTRVKQEILGQSEVQNADADKMPEIVNNNRITDRAFFDKLEQRFERRAMQRTRDESRTIR